LGQGQYYTKVKGGKPALPADSTSRDGEVGIS